jgi:hypothetical protein
MSLELAMNINSRSKQLASKMCLNGSPIDDTEGKLGQGLTSTDLLEEVDIGPGDRPKPTYVSAKLDPKYK